MTGQRNGRIVVLFAVLLAVSTMFPIVAAVLQPDPAPTWAGVADVSLAFLAAGCGFTIATRAGERFGDNVIRTSFRLYRMGATNLLALIGLYFIAGDHIGWNILLPGLAWRAWLLAWVLPAALTLWNRAPDA